MKATIEGSELVIRVPVNSQPPLSSSGKTKLVASYNGPTTVLVNGKPVKINLNAMIPAN